jgi:hypothetical protein
LTAGNVSEIPHAQYQTAFSLVTPTSPSDFRRHGLMPHIVSTPADAVEDDNGQQRRKNSRQQTAETVRHGHSLTCMNVLLDATRSKLRQLFSER